MTIQSVSDERVTYTLEFTGMAPANVEFELAARGEGTAVRWAMSGEMEGAVADGWFALTVDTLNGPAFEQGLANLKERFEARRHPGAGTPEPGAAAAPGAAARTARPCVCCS